MENQDAAAQLRALERVRDTAFSAVPVPYWIGLGILLGFGVATVSSGLTWLMVLAAVVIIVGGRILNAVLERSTGLRIGRVFGGATTWLVLPWFAAIAALSVVGRLLEDRLDAIWPGLAAGVVVLIVTLLFGRAYDAARRRRIVGRAK